MLQKNLNGSLNLFRTTAFLRFKFQTMRYFKVIYTARRSSTGSKNLTREALTVQISHTSSAMSGKLKEMLK